MLTESSVRAQHAHAQDLYREAEQDRLTYGALKRSKPITDAGRAAPDLGIMDRTEKAVLAAAGAVGVLTLAIVFLAGDAPGIGIIMR